MKRTVDPARVGKYHEATGIYIRASHNGQSGTFDIAELDTASLRAMLEESPDFAAGIVMTMLEHPQAQTTGEQQ